MRFSVLVVLCCLPMVLSACSSDVPSEELEADPGVETSGDVPGEADETPVAVPVPTTLNLASANGTVEADGYRLRFSLSAPIQAAPAENEGYQLNSITTVQSGQ